MGDGPDLEREGALHAEGYVHIAGVDEAGRGAWAGPLVAGATILPRDLQSLAEDLAGIRDSKLLSPRRRVHFYERVGETALALGTGVVSPGVLDQLGVVTATRLAMRRALDNLAIAPDYLLIDGFPLSHRGLPDEGVVGGDDLCFCIAAGSIVAKVVRDRMMVALDNVFPGYGFARHKGYGTPQHREALHRMGPCSIHRFSYAPMRFMNESDDREATGENVSGRRKALGRLGERMAARHLERQGYVICEMNYRCAVGEIDIVALDGDNLTFIEVRTRSSRRFGPPEESITAAKKQKLIEVAQTYLQEHESLPVDWRIDVVSIELSRRGKLRRLELIKDAIEG